MQYDEPLNAPVFLSARPVWLQGRETERNVTACFRVEVDGAAAAQAVVRLTASCAYRLFSNGDFLGYGPARGPHGYFRVDEWPLQGRCRPGANVIAIEVAGYNANSFYLLDQPSFLQAEVVAGRTVLASTHGAGTQFEAQVLASRVQVVQRYSFQRPFSEVYRRKPGDDAWRCGAPFQPQPLAEQPACALLPRLAPYPSFTVQPVQHEVAAGAFRANPARTVWADRTIKKIGPMLAGFPENDLGTLPFYEVQQMETTSQTTAERPLDASSCLPLADGQFRIVDFGRNNTGFFIATLRCTAPVRVFFAFDEILDQGDINVRRLECCNVVTCELTAAGTYTVESFEPYTLRYLKLIAAHGACEVSGLSLREYVNPEADRAEFCSSDEALNRIFEAARATFRQNAVDVFSDCPSRERAGWLCDSFFIGRVAADLCGNTRMEQLFFQNFLLPPAFAHLPAGMLPMCYPADHNDGVYIPNWAMWFVLQLEEYLQRSNDRAMVDALRPRVLALLEWYRPFRNSDGLLEKLPGWMFIEWSRANGLTQDVNYPTNMTYAAMLACAGRLYALPELLADAEALRATIRQQAFDGAFFVDNATRQPDGSLKLSGERTEVCQYYAFYFQTATPQTHAALWETLRADFGPGRRQTCKYPEIHFANAFIGNYLRLELLSQQGLTPQILAETRGYFLKMADLTGTLWEHDTTTASCCHGFASHLARVLYRDVLGVSRVDTHNRVIDIAFADAPLTSCSGTMPINEGRLTVRWRKEANTFAYHVEAPAGYRVQINTARLPAGTDAVRMSAAR